MSPHNSDQYRRAEGTPISAEPDRHEWREPPAYRFELDRRTALKLVGAGLFVAVSVEAIGQESGRRGGAGSDEVPDGIAAWIHVRADGAVDVFTGKAELGQNIRTSLTQVVADELRAPVKSIRVVMADTSAVPFDAGTFAISVWRDSIRVCTVGVDWNPPNR